jgi:hypothetical protein
VRKSEGVASHSSGLFLESAQIRILAARSPQFCLESLLSHCPKKSKNAEVKLYQVHSLSLTSFAAVCIQLLISHLYFGRNEVYVQE